MRRMAAALRLVALVCVWLLVLTMGLSPPFAPASAAPTGEFAAYFESWLSHAHDGLDTDLVSIPKSVTIVALAFMRPNAQYSGDLQLAGTGFDFDYSGSVLLDSIRELRRRNPGVKIFVSIGGETYTRWNRLNAPAIALFVKDFELDGVDVDFEPSNPGCVQTDASISCETDELLEQSIGKLRSSLSKQDVTTLLKAAIAKGAAGAMLFSLRKGTGPGAFTPFVNVIAAVTERPPK